MAQASEQHHPAFKLVRQQTIESLNINVSIYEHKETHAQHIHLDADNSENVFLVAFRTNPTDSTGVAHILEHTALCGSKNYPVRDPFFMMIRRSLNTFMNAFTANDWTAYPFASQNRKDYYNLLSVYLDAAFFSRLDPLDFAQEGHRMEFEEPDNPQSPLVYKGVVFNEMKGAMSSSSSILYDAICRHLNPTNTYHYNSGGDPAAIPDLTYEQLITFYKKHYHPSNASFMTYGDIPASEIQAELEEKVLQHFSPLQERIAVSPEKRLFAPISIKEHYALDPKTPIENQTHHVISWLWGSGEDLTHRLEAQLLSNVLLNNSASPLLHALETFPGAKSPSSATGLEDTHLELSFTCGVEGSNPEDLEAFEKCVFDCLEKVANEGIEQEKIESILHQLELLQREISGDSYPYGLQLILNCMSAAIHRSDPIALLDLDPALEQLREAIKDRDFIPNLIRQLLLENPHRVTLTLAPNHDINERRIAAEKARLAATKATLSEAELTQIKEQAAQLKARQEEQDDISILPKVVIDDIPEEVHYPTPAVDKSPMPNTHWPLTRFAQGTNGIAYQKYVIDFPELTADELSVIPIYTLCLGELGAGNKNYLEMQEWQARVSGGIGISSNFLNDRESTHIANGQLSISSRELNRHHKDLSELLQFTLEEARFDEGARIKELVNQKRINMERRVTGSGHQLAMYATGSRLSAASHIIHNLSGLAGIQQIKTLDDALKDQGALEQLMAQLTTLHNKFLNAPRHMLLITDAQHGDQCQQEILQQWSGHTQAGEYRSFNYPFTPGLTREVWLTNTQVNFCTAGFPTVPYNHPDNPALSILAIYLRNGYLHRTIREQGGAYGGGASHSKGNGVFYFYSYRDPRFTETLDDFNRSIEWLLNEPQDPELLEQAILGLISSIDKPGSPAGEAKMTFQLSLRGIDEAQRKSYRKSVMEVTLDDLKRVASTYLMSSDASKQHTTVVSQASTWESIKEKISLTPITL